MIGDEERILNPVGQFAQTGPKDYSDVGIDRNPVFKQGLDPLDPLFYFFRPGIHGHSHFSLLNIIREDSGVIKSQRRRQGVRVKNPQVLGIVSGPGSALGPGNKNGAEGMAPGVAIRVGIGVHLPHQAYLERGLLSGLPDGCLLQGFPVIHKTPR